jgi:DhnA family fructose-bisphosphate aldolase class Ia
MVNNLGVYRRMHRLFPADRPAVWLPIDDALISGPELQLRDPRRLLSRKTVENLDAVLAFKGMLKICAAELANTACIVNLSASTVKGEHTRKMKVGKVDDAVSAGADAVAYHINVSSPFENEMIRDLGAVISEADTLGMPTIVLAYPRSVKHDGTDENYHEERSASEDDFARRVRHCVRVAIDLGASAVKTIFTGSVESFSSVIDHACGVPVLIAGEELLPRDAALDKAQMAIRAGAAGVAFGRQVFQRDDPSGFVKELRNTVDQERISIDMMRGKASVSEEDARGSNRLA